MFRGLFNTKPKGASLSKIESLKKVREVESDKIQSQLLNTYNFLKTLSQKQIEDLLYTSIFQDYINYYTSIQKVKEQQLEGLQKIAEHLNVLDGEIETNNSIKNQLNVELESVLKKITEISTSLEEIPKAT